MDFGGVCVGGGGRTLNYMFTNRIWVASLTVQAGYLGDGVELSDLRGEVEAAGARGHDVVLRG